MSKLPVSRLINVQVLLGAQAARSQNLSSLLLLVDDPVIDVAERMRTYEQLTDVAMDFGTDSVAYGASAAWFGQTPQPRDIRIGRLVRTATSAQLLCGRLANVNQDIASWKVITAGGFHITTNDTAYNIESLDFSGTTNLNGVASIIQAAIRSATSGAQTVVYDDAGKRFVFTNSPDADTDTIGFLEAADQNDISAMLSGTKALGAYIAESAAAETPVEAAALFDDRFGQQWYLLNVPDAENDENIALADFVEGTTNKHFLAITTDESGSLSNQSTVDIGARIEAGGYKKTAVQYSSSSKYAALSMMARILTTNYAANNSVITLMYKQEPGVIAEELSSSNMAVLASKNINVFVAYNNETNIIERGTVGSGDFIDLIVGIDNLSVQIMTAVYNLLYTTPTKVPQTDAGSGMIVAVIEQVLAQYLRNGFLGAGTWTQDGFGELSRGDFMPTGYYVYAPPVSQQLQEDREARKSVPIQIAAKTAGAVHTVDIILSVNR